MWVFWPGRSDWRRFCQAKTKAENITALRGPGLQTNCCIPIDVCREGRRSGWYLYTLRFFSSVRRDESWTSKIKKIFVSCLSWVHCGLFPVYQYTWAWAWRLHCWTYEVSTFWLSMQYEVGAERPNDNGKAQWPSCEARSSQSNFSSALLSIIWCREIGERIWDSHTVERSRICSERTF